MRVRRWASVSLAAALVTTPLTAAPLFGATDAQAAPAEQESLGRHQVRIVRDNFGIPHVYASTVRDLFYGYGYAVGQDRLFQMEMSKRSTQGTVAEVLGKDYADFDVSTRGNFSPAQVQAQYDALPQRDRDIFDGYAEGLNAWVDKVEQSPAKLLPKEFSDYDFKPGRWTGFDVVMIFVGTMANRFSDSNDEIGNLGLLTALKEKYGDAKGKIFFDQLKWLVDEKAQTTIAPRDATSFQGSAGDADAGLKGIDPGSAATADTEATPDHSNAWVVGSKRSRDARSMLLNGPQFNWFVPAYTFSIGLHGAGYDVVGSTPFAYPVVLFAHNSKIAWGATAGFGDTVDMFQEQLKPDDPHMYRHDGKWLKMDKRVDTVKVRGEQPRQVEVYRTVHGLVTTFDLANHVAYAKQRTWEGHELDTLLGWIHSMQAQDYRSWRQQASRMAITINWYYADDRGNIGYIHTGKYPIRAKGQDPRLPTVGTGAMDWRGIQPFDQNPQVYNPGTGYIVNWNNSPEPGYPSPDYDSFSIIDRVAILHDQFRRHETVDPKTLWGFIKDSASEDVNAWAYVPFAEAAAKDATPGSDARLLADILAKWNQHDLDENGDGRYDDAGTAVMRAWLPIVLQRVLADDIPDAYDAKFLGTRYYSGGVPSPGSINTSLGTRVVYNALLGDKAGVAQNYDVFNGEDHLAVLRETLDAAAKQLRKTYGDNVDDWRVPVAGNVFGTKNFLGIPQTTPDRQLETKPFANRGTENNLMVFKAPGENIAWEVTAPGQSGFIAPDGTTGPHYADQLKMFEDFKRHRTWLSTDEVSRHKESEEVLRPPSGS